MVVPGETQPKKSKALLSKELRQKAGRGAGLPADRLIAEAAAGREIDGVAGARATAAIPEERPPDTGRRVDGLPVRAFPFGEALRFFFLPLPEEGIIPVLPMWQFTRRDRNFRVKDLGYRKQSIPNLTFSNVLGHHIC